MAIFGSRQLVTHLGLSALIAGESLAPQNVAAQQPPCRDQAAVGALARAYVLAIPLYEVPTILRQSPESLKVYVPRHSAFFQENGESIRCAHALSRGILRQVINVYDPKAAERAAEVATRAGLPEFAADVAREAQRPLGDMVMMAIELEWLAQVLPAMARGDNRPYDTNPYEIRRVQRVGVMALEAMARSDRESAWMLSEMAKVMNALVPILERAIVQLAITLPIQ